MTIATDRLVLRAWRDDDIAPFAAMSADPEVMHHFPALLDRAGTEALVARWREHHAREGFGIWVLEVAGAFGGVAGLARAPFITPDTVEVGWRLARPMWGRGLATEAARAAVAYGFGTLALPEIVAFLLPSNTRSRAVALRLGMQRDPTADFDHPRVKAELSIGGHPVRRHHLYRLRRTENT